jgi:tagatose 1,6-diphosphate aldolase
MVTVSQNVFERLKKLADQQKRFFMLAIDQRGSIKKMLAKIYHCEPFQVPDQAIIEVKKIIVEILGPHASAVLIDPEYGFEGGYQAIPDDVGKLLTLEKSGGEQVKMNGIEEERTLLLPNWSVAQALAKGADAVKLLVPYHPKASEETKAYQEVLVKQIGLECNGQGLPFLVEFTSFPITKDPANLKQDRLQIVAQTAHLFDQSEYNITIHKVEFPGDINSHSQTELTESCQRVDAAVAKPWVLLSAGVDFPVFEKQLELVCHHGASGFLAGRAIWQEAIGLYDEGHPSQEKMQGWLQDVGVGRFERLKQAGESAKPFTEKVKFSS